MSDQICPSAASLVEERLNRVLTQYRESPKLLFVLRTYLNAVAETAVKICDLPSFFDIETAIGDQLTIIGKRLGWPRCHCICDVQPVFGFECEGVVEEYPIAGFCDDSVTWVECGEFGAGDICIIDDEIYRKFLKVRRYQMKSLFDSNSLNESVKILFGDQAEVLNQFDNRVIVAPNKTLSDAEIALLQLYPRILPVALGIEIRFHFDNIKVFGFGDGWGGFCEPWSDAVKLTTNDGYLTNQNDTVITTGVMTRDAPWMCEVDVKPYEC
jgi:hypothetical protein